jgi:hypothetical protein
MRRASRGITVTIGVAAVVAGLIGMPSTATAEEASVDSTVGTLAERIAVAAEEGAETPEELARATGLPEEGPASLRMVDGRVSATVAFAATPTETQLARLRELARIERVFTVAPRVAVTAAPEDLVAIGAIDGVLSVAPDLRPSSSADRRGPVPPAAAAAAAAVAAAAAAAAPARAAEDPCRAFPADGDAVIGAAQARERFGVDGTGVTVGILSDSYGADTTVTTPQDDVEAGLLPGPGNPCGYETPVEVLTDLPDGEGTDEGRAMAQLVHGIAPGARLLFATTYPSPATMAQAIEDLAAAGATVIVDDVIYAEETYFQQSLISASIARVRAEGVAYYTSAGNDNVIGEADRVIGSWQTPAYRPTSCPSWVQTPERFGDDVDCLDFDPAGGADPTELLGFNGEADPSFILSWGEPIGGLRTSFSLQLYDTSPTPQLLASETVLDRITPNALTIASEPLVEGTYQLVLVRDAGSAPEASPAIWISTWGGGWAISWREYDRSVGDDVVGPTMQGHHGDGSGVGVAAAYWQEPDVPERYSSIGPITLLFEPYDPYATGPAAPLAVPVRTSEPSIAGLDGQRTSFFGQTTSPETLPEFFGTSAAAPTVAAVHALASSYAPGTAADVVTAAMTATARGMTNPYAGVFPDAAVFGAGLADAEALLAALPLAAVGGVAVTAVSASSVAASWTDVPHAAGYAVELLRGDAAVVSTEVAQGAGSATFADVLPDTEYRVRVTTLADGGTVGGAAVSGVVRTPVPPQPAVVPAAPAESALVDADRGGLVAGGSSVVAGGTVTVSGLPADTWVHGWVYSTPVSLGWAWTGAAGTATFTVPADLPAGRHRIAVTDAAGTLLGWVDLTVTARAVAFGSLAATGLGVDLTPVSLAAAVATLGGAVLLLTMRRRPTVRR